MTPANGQGRSTPSGAPANYNALAWAVVAAIAATVLGSNASTIGIWVIQAFNSISGRGESANAEAEGAVIAIGVGFMVILLIGAHVARRTGVGAAQVVGSTIAAIVGSVFSVVKAMQAPDVDATALKPLYYIVVVAILFLLAALRPAGGNRVGGMIELYFRIPIAGLIGFAFGGIVSLLPMLMHGVPSDLPSNSLVLPTHHSFLLVGPAATGALISVWAIVAFDPLIEKGVWEYHPDRQRVWIATYLAAAVILAIVYVVWIEHDTLLERPDVLHISATSYVVGYLLLLLAPLFATGLYLLRSDEPWQRRVPAAAALVIVADIVAMLVLVLVSGMPWFAGIAFALIHVATAVLVVTAVRLAAWIWRRA